MLRYGLMICWAVMVLTGTIFGWTAGNLTVDVVNSPMNIKVSAGTKTLAEITTLTFATTNFTSISSVATTTDSLVLTLSGTVSLCIKAIQGGLRFYSRNPSVTSVKLTLRDQGEHFYGITQHNLFSTLNPDLRGQTVQDKVYQYPQADEDAETYSGFYFTSLGYAGYFDSFANGTYVFGVSSQTTITYNYSSINWYLFYGPTLSKVQKSYFALIGAPKKVPMWACGPLVWHDNFTGSAMMLTYAANFVTIQIPYSTMWLDRPYNNGINGWSNMNFEGNFANPGTWIPRLRDSFYVNLVTWIMPGVFSGGTYPAGAFTSTPNVYLDLTLASNVTWYKDKLTAGQYPYGVKGHKMDRVDNGWPSGPTLPAFSDGTPAEERHHKYVYLNAKMTDEMLRTNAGLGDDQFNFPRAAVARCQQYICAIWNGDSYGNWGGMQTCMGNAIRAGFLGFPMWGSDVCGYTQTSMPQIDNYCRWLEFGAYSGFMELMLDGKEPWNLSAANQDSVRKIFNLRFTLLPYIYSILNTSADNGVSMKPLVGEYPDESATYSMWDEYLFGPAMLVAPISSSTNSRSVYLPTGKWINLYNFTDSQAGPATITTPTMPLTQIPVYIKSNSIYPTGQVFAGLARKWDPTFDSRRNIVINTFPGAAGDSNTFTYVDYLASNAQKTLSVQAFSSNVIHVTSPAMTVAGKVIVRLKPAPTSVTLNNVALSTSQYTYTAGTMSLEVPFAASVAVDLWINGSVKTVDCYTRPSVCGRVQVRLTGHDIELILPPAMGMRNNSRIEASILDMRGKQVWKSSIATNQICSAPCKIRLDRMSRGSYFTLVKINGVVAQRSKIIVP